MNKLTLVAHESLDIHELLNFKTICLATSKLMQGIVFNQELKALMASADTSFLIPKRTIASKSSSSHKG